MSTKSGPLTIRGAAARDLTALLEEMVRWKDALPNDSDSFRAAGARAQAILEALEETALRTKTDLRALGSREELNAQRQAWFQACWKAMDGAEAQWGPEWKMIQGNLWVVRVPREVARWVNREFKASYDAMERNAPAEEFWEEIPEGTRFLHPYRPPGGGLKREPLARLQNGQRLAA